MSDIASNVWQFIDRSSELVGRLEAENFSQDMQANCLELGMQSPIEHLFWVAMTAMCKASFEPWNPGPIELRGEAAPGHGIHCQPQRQIGPYRVDFCVERVPFLAAQACSPVVVELDGHAFHDKDKRQRSYEKARDRYLVKAGYRVLHYPGSDIAADPFKVAHEVLVMLNAANSPEYVPSDPFGVN